MWVFDEQTLAFLAVNEAACRHYGYARTEFLGMTIRDIRPEGDVPSLLRQLASEPKSLLDAGIWRHRKKDGTVIEVQITSHPFIFDGKGAQFVLALDVTERRKLEAQLRQAQKMEAVGRLAGGVAHDFNNLLTVIQGYGEMLAPSLQEDETRREQVAEVLKAAGRAATLTRQLLAFSRRQVLMMRILDLGAVVGETEKMLRRLIGEDVELLVARPAGTFLVKADSGQFEQVLVNLVLNARDAMPSGGRLIVEVSEIRLAEEFPAMPEPVPAGRWVVLTVGDNGGGMNAETPSHVFEPFFTTKEMGKGTRLGLATVYGIVKQSGGFVTVASAPGQGTTFRIFLARAEEEVASTPEEPARGTGGTETVLLVEDDPSVRGLTCRLLEGRGYRALAAESGADALALADRHEGPIDLLLTDLVMPGLSGRNLATAVGTRRPGTRVLFMSGYSSDLLSREGLRKSGVHFLQKPFTEAALARSVREALDSPAPDPSAVGPDI